MLKIEYGAQTGKQGENSLRRLYTWVMLPQPTCHCTWVFQVPAMVKFFPSQGAHLHFGPPDSLAPHSAVTPLHSFPACKLPTWGPVPRPCSPQSPHCPALAWVSMGVHKLMPGAGPGIYPDLTLPRTPWLTFTFGPKSALSVPRCLRGLSSPTQSRRL